MITADALHALRDAAGESAVLEHDPIALDGVKIGLTLAPPDDDALAATLAVASAQRIGLLVRGGGSRLGVGNRPDARATAWLSTAALAGRCEVEADEGVVYASAGTSVGELASLARDAGWESPLEPLGPTSTVGGALATAGVGPRALGFGRPRDFVLGLDVALASGERTRCGARVVKNVSGYDLVKLQLGAFGSLGVLTGAWLRLRPRPEAVWTCFARPHAGEAPERFAIASARRPGARAAAWLDGSVAERLGAGSEGCLLIEFASDAAVVAEAEIAMRAEAECTEPAEDAVAGLREIENEAGPGGLRFRIGAPPSASCALRASLRAAGAATILHPGLSTAIASFPLERNDEVEVDRACRAVRGALAEADGHWLLERVPAFAKEGRDVFGTSRATLPLMRSLKREFDPEGILNPGRFVGGL